MWCDSYMGGGYLCEKSSSSLAKTLLYLAFHFFVPKAKESVLLTLEVKGKEVCIEFPCFILQ